MLEGFEEWEFISHRTHVMGRPSPSRWGVTEVSTATSVCLSEPSRDEAKTRALEALVERGLPAVRSQIAYQLERLVESNTEGANPGEQESQGGQSQMELPDD